MDIKLSLHQRKISLSESDQSFAQAASSRNAMSQRFQRRIAGKLGHYLPTTVLNVSPGVLEVMIRKYSEQLVHQPLEEMNFWFSYYSGLFLEPGYPPLYYMNNQKKLSPNKSAISALGEGIAGLIMQRIYQARKLARPVHDYPDIVMTRDTTAYLVEAKATTISPKKIQQVLDDEIIRMCVYTSACRRLDKSSEPCGVLVGTALSEKTHYQTYITEITV